MGLLCQNFLLGPKEDNGAEHKFQPFTGNGRFLNDTTSDHDSLIDSSSVTSEDVEKQTENSLNSEMDKLELDSNEIFPDEEEQKPKSEAFTENQYPLMDDDDEVDKY